MSNNQRNILVTGGGKGIGFSTILQTIKEGAFVYTIVRSKKDIKRWNDKILKYWEI